ncbi:GATA-type domain-containing protein, partial [Haematococcus lacustris]
LSTSQSAITPPTTARCRSCFRTRSNVPGGFSHPGRTSLRLLRSVIDSWWFVASERTGLRRTTMAAIATAPGCEDGSLALLDAIDYVLKNEGTGGLPTDELVEGLASGDEDEPFSSRRKGGRRTSFLGGPCAHCGEADSPQWRRPANRNMVLCNACGIYYSRHNMLPRHRKACPSTVEPSSEARPPGSPAQPPLMADKSPSSPATVTRQAVQHKPALLAIASVAGNLPELHRTAPKPGCHSPVA